MLELPAQLKIDYTRLLQQRNIPQHSHNAYLKSRRVGSYPTILGTSLILQNLHFQKNVVRQSPNRSDNIAVFDSDDSSTISNRVAGWRNHAARDCSGCSENVSWSRLHPESYAARNAVARPQPLQFFFLIDFVYLHFLRRLKSVWWKLLLYSSIFWKSYCPVPVASKCSECDPAVDKPPWLQKDNAPELPAR